MQELYRDKHWQIIQDEAPLRKGGIKKISRAKRADVAHILAFPDVEHILLLHEYRPFYKDQIWMLPSGHIDKEVDVLVGAQRELQEETGFRASKLTHLWSTNVTELIISTNHFFLAEELVKDPREQDEDEDIEVHHLTLEDALQKVHQSSVIHLPSAYGILRWMKEQKL